MLNDLDFYNCSVKMNAAVYDAKEIFGENLPYTLEYKLTGNVVVFNDHFIMTVREAMTNGCMAKMNEEEEALFRLFIDYEDGTSFRDITRGDDNIVKALDKWLVNLVSCTANPKVNECYDSAKHTWKTCTS